MRFPAAAAAQFRMPTFVAIAIGPGLIQMIRWMTGGADSGRDGHISSQFASFDRHTRAPKGDG